MSAVKSAEPVKGAKILYLIFTTVFLTLFFRFGLFGLLTAYHFPYISLLSLAVVLAALIARLFITLFGRSAAITGKMARMVTVIEWTCWTFLATHPLLLPFTYLRISAKLPLAIRLKMIDHLFVLALAFLFALLSIIAICKGRRFLYVFCFYMSITLTVFGIADSLLPETKDFGPREEIAKEICKIEGAEPQISYQCEDSQKPWCDFLFEHSAPYKVIYHAPTNQLVISGGNSELLLFLDMNTKKVNKFLKFDDDVKYLTYDKFRDKILIDVRQQGCLIEVDPYAYAQTNCYFKDPAIREEFQLGCFDESGDFLTYNMDTKGNLFTRDYRTCEEKIHSTLPFVCAYGMVCRKDKVIISSGCPSSFFRSGLIKVEVEPEFKIVQKKRTFLPAMEVEYDLKKDLLYIARPTPGRIDIYRPTDLKKVGSIKAIGGARELALDEKKGYLYAGSFGSGEIVRIDLNSKRIDKRYSVGPLLRDLIFIDELDAAFAASACGVYKLND